MTCLPAEPRRATARRSSAVHLVAALILGLGMAGCTEPPFEARAEAERALDRARRAGAGASAPAVFAAAEQAWSEAEDQMKNGSRLRADASFRASARRSELAERIHTRRREETEARARRMLARAEDGLEELSWLAGYLPPRSPIRPGIKKAEVGVLETVALLKSGDPRRALASAREAAATISQAYQRIEVFLLGGHDPDRIERYRRWVDQTIASSKRSGQPAIIVDKMRRTVTLVSAGRRVHSYRAELGINGTLVKVVAGDRATPEGLYKVTEKRGPQHTKWYKALMLNYPNNDDLERFRQARRRGQVPKNANPGSLIEIHGKGGRGEDWTDGCVALSNADMDHIFSRVAVGTPVTIVGFEVGANGAPSVRRGTAEAGT